MEIESANATEWMDGATIAPKTSHHCSAGGAVLQENWIS